MNALPEENLSEDIIETPSVDENGSKIVFRDGVDGRKVFSKGNDNTRVHYNPKEAASFNDESGEEAFILAPSNNQRIKAERSFWFRAAQTCGILGSIAWALICVTYFLIEGGFTAQTPYETGVFVAGMLAPVAFYWMLLSYLQRGSDVQYYAESLRAEMHTLFFPSDEDSKRVNKDIERMTQQAAELAASSRAALKSIHRTRHGMRQEMKNFVELARKAESHLIGLSDRLVERSAGLNDMVDVMDSRIESLSEKSQKSITVWDEASAAMITRAAEIEQSMDKGAERILTMAEVAQEKSKAVSETFDGTITSLGLTVDAVVDRLGGMSEEFGSYTRSLSVSIEDLSKETSRMSTMIDDQVEQLQEAAGRSVETITQSLVSVSEHKDLLLEGADILVFNADKIAQTVDGAVSKLETSAESLEERTEVIASRLDEKSSMMTGALNGVEEQIERIDSMSELASHRLSEGIDTAVNGATQVSDAIRRGIDNLTRTSKDATAEATSIIEATISHIQQLKDVGQGNVQSVEAMVDLLERSRQQIELASQSAQAHVKTLSGEVETQSNRLEVTAASLADQVKSVTRSLEEPLKMVGVALADADGRHEQIQTTMERRIRELREAGERASETVEVIRQSLREQTQDITTLTGQAMAQSKALNLELSENKSQLTETIDKTIGDMARLTDSMISVRGDIDETATMLNTRLSETMENIDGSAYRLHDASAFAQSALESASGKFAEQTTLLDTNVSQATSTIEQATHAVTYASEKILPLYDRVENGATRAQSALNNFKENYLETAQTALERFDASSLRFDEALLKLHKGSEQASVTLRTTSEELKDRLNDIEMSAESANEKMHALTQSMAGQSSDIHILSDQVTLKMEGVQRLVNEQFQELSEGVSQAVTEIENAGGVFEGRADKISFNVDTIINRFAAAGNEAELKANALKQAAFNISATASDSVAQLEGNIHTLTQCSEVGLSNLVKTADSIAIKSKEVDVMMHSVLDQAKSYTAEMKDQVRAVAAQSDQSVTEIGHSVTKLAGQMDIVNEKTRTVVSYIHESNQSLYDQSGRFVTAVAKSTQAADQATEMFSRQTDNLLKAARIAVEKAEDIRNAELRAGRETFMNSARFVLESLHSLSIDFMRMMDGEIADKDWKSYQKGDVALFSTKLVERLGDMPADKIRNKYAEDTEFRNYVQKFIRQFEDVLEQTDTVDRGAILGTTFAASDVGKIYRFLCNVIGKDVKLIQKAA